MDYRVEGAKASIRRIALACFALAGGFAAAMSIPANFYE
jgi:hypothetical protein